MIAIESNFSDYYDKFCHDINPSETFVYRRIENVGRLPMDMLSDSVLKTLNQEGFGNNTEIIGFCGKLYIGFTTPLTSEWEEFSADCGYLNNYFFSKAPIYRLSILHFPQGGGVINIIFNSKLANTGFNHFLVGQDAATNLHNFFEKNGRGS